jgi:hypothetical protein
VIGADGDPVIDPRGKRVNTGQRLIDPEGEPTVRRMFDLAEKRMTPGEVSRQLNREGATTKRGKQWTTRAVRGVLRNDDYVGRNGYPKLIEQEQFDAVQRWLDVSKRPQGVARGRPAADDFVLAGFAFCALCDAPMRSRRCSTTGRRTYRCSNAMEGRNSCSDSVPVPAAEAEAMLIRNLAYYRGDLDAFLVEQVADRQQAQQAREDDLRRLRDQLAKLDRTRERLMADYRRQVEDGRSTAHLALEEVERVDSERERVQEAVRNLDAIAAEHAGEPELDEVRELYERLMAFAKLQVERAATPAEVRTVLRGLVAEVRLHAIGQLPTGGAVMRLPAGELSNRHARGFVYRRVWNRAPAA